ncbi:MAG: purine-nucleoside phosphorylase [Erysipelotrichaceae bacterium]|nr:purine-nucleoside phosphorylase [Erysipelotrichaceae bacterium]
MSMHISAKPGEIAEDVLLPGDPLRAKYIAETYLENPVLVNTIRNMFGYTGYYKGKRITVFATGMGIPSIMIYATELIREYGAKRLIRLGTSGAIRESLNVGDIVLSSAISTTSGINLYNLPGTFAPTADFELLEKCYHVALDKGIKPYVGNTLSNDYLYVDNKPEYSRQWERYGLLASEQEGAGLYTVAAKENVKAMMISTIVVNLYRPDEELPPETREKGLNNMIEIALDTLVD